jgi:hypothetical protein
VNAIPAEYSKHITEHWNNAGVRSIRDSLNRFIAEQRRVYEDDPLNDVQLREERGKLYALKLLQHLILKEAPTEESQEGSNVGIDH